MVVENPALGGQPALSLRLGDPDVTEDRGIDGSTSGGWQSNRWLFATLYNGVYSYLGDVANNPGENIRLEKTVVRGFIATGCRSMCQGRGHIRPLNQSQGEMRR